MTRAQQFAKRYTEITEALLQEGVPVRVARQEARLAATLIYLVPEHREQEVPCPVCGREE